MHPASDTDHDCLFFRTPRAGPQRQDHRNLRERWHVVSIGRPPSCIPEGHHLGQVLAVGADLVITTEQLEKIGPTSHASRYPTTMIMCMGSLFHGAE